MFPKAKSSAVPSDNQAKEKLASYVYEYLIHIGASKAANTFLQEIHWDKSWPIGEPPGFLNQWWCVFYDLYNAAPERRENFEHSSEAKAFHDYGFVNSGYPNGLARNPSIASPISGGMPPTGGRPPSSQGIIPPDNGIHTPVSIPGGQMMVQGGHFFAPNHPISNLGVQGMEVMRNRPLMPPIRFPAGPMLGNYHPGAIMPRQRFNNPQSVGIVHSPGPSGTPQSGPPIMPSPNDSLQNDVQQNTSGQQDSQFGHNNINGSLRSPSHVMSQPAPAFPPPPASENNNDQSHTNLINGGGSGNNGPTMSQFQQQQHQQPHTMEYMPSFEPPHTMKHSPQLHSVNDVIASMNNGSGGGGMVNDFCNPMMAHNGPPSFSDHSGMRISQPSLHMGMSPLSQIHMMQQQQQQQQQQQHHNGPIAMQNMPGGPSLPGSFISSHPGVPIGSNPQYPDYGFTSMSQAI